MNRIVMHIDVNSAFVSWSAVEILKRSRKDIREFPSIIGYENSKRHGIVLAASIPAKKLGIKVPEPIYMAKKKCESLIVIEPNYKLYEKMSCDFCELVKSYTPDVEKYSVDECFLEYGPVMKLYGDPVLFATKLKNEIKEKLGFTVNIGVGSNKFLAKMASDFEKPDKVHTLFISEIEKIYEFPINKLFGCGRKASEKLISIGIKTIGELAKYDKQKIIKLLGKQGEIIWDFANGIDNSIVGDVKPKDESISKEITLSYDFTSKEEVYKIIRKLVSDVSLSLREKGKYASVVSVYLKYSDFSVKSKQKKNNFELCNENDIYDLMIEIFNDLWDGNPIRLIGVRISSFSCDRTKQLSMFDKSDNRGDNIQTAIDKINNKFGKKVIKSASIIDDK